jgi:hypothetical protein
MWREDLLAMPDGRGYRVDVQGGEAAITPVLAAELRRVLEIFAADAGFDDRRPVQVMFKPGIFGHHRVGRAADIYGVGGIGIGEWKSRWDEAGRGGIGNQANLGWRL